MKVNELMDVIDYMRIIEEFFIEKEFNNVNKEFI